MTRNTLKDMQEAGLADADGELTIPKGDENPEIDVELDPDAVVADGEGEAEIVLGDAQDAPKDELEPGLKRTLSHLRRDRRELRGENAGLSSENTALKARLDQLTAATLKKPRYVDFPTDDAYEAALLQYHAITGGQQPKPKQPNPPRQQQAPDFSKSINAHYERAEKLGVNLAKFETAERNVRTQIGDVLTDALIDAVGVGSEKAVMLLGTNKKAFDELKSLLSSDPTGLKATTYLGRLAERARVTKSRVSGAGKPTRSPTGAGAIVPMGTLEKKLEAAEKTGDPNKMFKARRAISKAKRAAASQ